MPLTSTECLWQCQPLKAADQHLNGVLGGVHAPLFTACVATRGPCVLVCFTLYVCVQAASTCFAICVVRSRLVAATIATLSQEHCGILIDVYADTPIYICDSKTVSHMHDLNLICIFSQIVCI